MSKSGLDVSHWQHPPGGPENPIDYGVAKEQGIDFVMCRTTNGKDYDSAFQAHFDGVLDADLVGAGYHYLRIGQSGVQTQMDSILEVLDGRKPSFYDLDVEAHHNAEYDSPTVRDKTYYMLTALEENLECPILVYCNDGFFGNRIGDRIMVRDYTNQPKVRANYWGLHVASWGFNDGTPYEGGPYIPRGWRIGEAGDGPYKNQWEIWQYTSRLVLPGVGGSGWLDGNEMTDRFWAEITDEPEPDPDPDPDPDPVPVPTGTFRFEGTGTLVH